MLTAGKSLFNLALRGLSMGGRFLLIFYMGKFFSLEDLGYYGIFYTTVTLALFLLGLDFYGFSNRELLLVERHKRMSILRAQALFYVFTYVVFLLPLFLVFTYGVIPLKFVMFFYVILVLEHLAQELYRIFTVLG